MSTTWCKTVAVFYLSVVVAACGNQSRREANEASRPDRAALTAPYPRARWRLARERLEHTVLTVSHLLVVHAASSGDESNLRMGHWRPEPVVKRTRAEALELAIELAAKARAKPDDFAELARRHSDDLASRGFGGSLGAWSPNYMPAEFLDALATMKVGEVSRVIETPLGFHVLKLRETAPERMVAARQIVISYREADPIAPRKGRDISRSRAEAEQIAKQVAELARKEPSRFAELVEAHSDASDALLGGDIGLWSTHRAFVYNRELEVIAALQVGEVSEPVDSFGGFKVFLRTEGSARPTIAASAIELKHSPAEASKLADEILRALAANPGRFAEFQEKYCCKEIKQWAQGRGDADVEHVVSALAMGEIAKAPLVLADGGLSILRRVDPTKEDAPDPGPVSFSLPAPASVDIEYFVKKAADERQLQRYTSSLFARNDALLGAQVDATKVKVVKEIFHSLAQDFLSKDPEKRVASYVAARESLRKELGSAVYGRFIANLEDQISEDLMRL